MAKMDLGPETLIGTWRRFGVAGPVYEIIGPGAAAPGKAEVMRVRVLESGEELDYQLANLLDDPVER
ncbi:MAG: DUF5397 family protein [Caulobacteraceae bacterium]